MNTTIGQYLKLAPITLLTVMALTRFGHFGSAFSLPDASLAVFFLAGLYFNKPKFFMLLLVEAGLIDYLAITQFSVSDFCISPAYVCLLPTYAVMWFAGRYCKPFIALGFGDSSKTFGWAATATIAAFIISNGSFYLFSGSFGELSWDKYWLQTAHYLPSYLSATLVYIVIGLAVVKLMKAARALAPVES
jgi:hypothetical protein